MERLLLEQQHGHCCYCMRTIAFKRHTTLEHVIPHHLKDLKYLACYWNRFPRLRHYISYVEIEKNPNRRISIPPYPHFCAYDNLVISCDGSIPDPKQPEKVLPSRLHLCCNNARGNENIVPLFFIRRIHKEIVYEADGEMTYDETKYAKTIYAINLEHETLKLMRRTWANLVRGSRFTINDVQKACSDNLLRKKILEASPIPIQDVKNLQADIYWNTLYSYQWFFHYFKHKGKRTKK